MDNIIFDGVANAITSGAQYYVGAKKCLNENSTFCWMDRTKVERSVNTNMHKTDDDCVYTYNGQFFSNKCTNTKSFLCQKDREPPVLDGETTLFVTDAGGHSVLCSGKVCAPTWNDNGTYIKNTTTQKRDEIPLGITQQVVGQHSRLWFKQVDGNSNGVYSCKTSNDNSSRREIQVKVLGKPQINKIIKSTCSAEVTIEWTPGQYAVNFPHTVSVSNEFRVGVTPTHKTIQRTYITNLMDSKQYKVKITSCTKNCWGYFSPQARYFVTGGIPNNVTNLKAMISKKHVCTISWGKPHFTNAVIGYKLHIRENIKVYRGISPAEHAWRDESLNMSFSFSPKPNRLYTASVRAVNCAGTGLPTMTASACDISPAAPNKIDDLQLKPSNVASEPSILVTIPEETNGLISCILVMIRTATDDHVRMNETTKELSITDFVRRFSNNKQSQEYLAIAIPPKRFLNRGKVIEVALGNESISSCFVKHTGTGNSLETKICKEDSICAENRMLLNRTNYKAYAIVVVPSETTLSIRRSNDLPFSTILPEKQKEDLGALIIVGGALGAVICILVISLAVYMMRKRALKNGFVPNSEIGREDHTYDIYDMPDLPQNRNQREPTSCSEAGAMENTCSASTDCYNLAQDDLNSARSLPPLPVVMENSGTSTAEINLNADKTEVEYENSSVRLPNDCEDDTDVVPWTESTSEGIESRFSETLQTYAIMK